MNITNYVYIEVKEVCYMFYLVIMNSTATFKSKLFVRMSDSLEKWNIFDSHSFKAKIKNMFCSGRPTDP